MFISMCKPKRDRVPAKPFSLRSILDNRRDVLNKTILMWESGNMIIKSHIWVISYINKVLLQCGCVSFGLTNILIYAICSK